MNTSEAFDTSRWWLLPPLALLVLIYAPIYPRMFGDWMNDPNYSHGLLVPFISAWFAWRAWPKIKSETLSPSNMGFVTMAAGVLLLGAGVSIGELYTSRVSLLLLLAGAIHALCGRRVLGLLALPIGYLLFMIPIPYTIYDALALPLKTVVATAATAGLKIFGMPVLREGNMIILPNISLEVVEACSGMRSLVSLMALGTAAAFIFLDGYPRRCALIAVTVPIAVLTNIFRVFVTGILARHVGPEAAGDFFHNFAGLAVFGMAMVLTGLAVLALRHKGKTS